MNDEGLVGGGPFPNPAGVDSTGKPAGAQMFAFPSRAIPLPWGENRDGGIVSTEYHVMKLVPLTTGARSR